MRTVRSPTSSSTGEPASDFVTGPSLRSPATQAAHCVPRPRRPWLAALSLALARSHRSSAGARSLAPEHRFPLCSLVQMSQFVDEAQLNVRGGDGGAGCVSFRREGPVAKGGPNGGDGGRGGDVWLVADHNVASLLAFRDHPHRRAESGVHGKGKDLHGRRGQDLVITVPEGTVVKDLYTGEVLAELLRH